MPWLDDVKWDRDGLVPAIAQEAATGDVLMFAYMNREALQATAERGEAVYWSRSRQRLWHKGEESGHVQTVHDIRLDCDGDVILLRVTQHGHEPGIACHTGRHSCFFRTLRAVEGPQTGRPAGVRSPEGDEKAWGGPAFSHEWISVDPVLKDPQSIYK